MFSSVSQVALQNMRSVKLGLSQRFKWCYDECDRLAYRFLGPNRGAEDEEDFDLWIAADGLQFHCDAGIADPGAAGGVLRQRIVYRSHPGELANPGSRRQHALGQTGRVRRN